VVEAMVDNAHGSDVKEIIAKIGVLPPKNGSDVELGQSSEYVLFN
jgi:hypothetical protein